uniref:Uncharacterized protein n=1 Tax=Salix viminalis TaxID=40686 RepID=A0A6N2MIQ6_SALVM
MGSCAVIPSFMGFRMILTWDQMSDYRVDHRTNSKIWLSDCEEGLKRLELFFCLRRTYRRISAAASLHYLVSAGLVSPEHSPLYLLSDLLRAEVQGELRPLASATRRLEGTVGGERGGREFAERNARSGTRAESLMTLSGKGRGGKKW